MRTFYTCVFLCLIVPFVANAQSLRITHSDNVVNGDTTLSTVVAHIEVANNTAYPIDVKVKRQSNELAENHQSYFCWDICYGPGTNESEEALTIDANGSNNFFRGYLKPYGTPGTSEVLYCFFNQGNISDSTCVLLTYTISTSVSGVASGSYILSEAYPNPVSESLTIPYMVSSVEGASISVSDMYGRTILRKEVTAPAGIIMIDASEFASGMYLYSLVSETGTLTRRFIKE